MRRRLAMLCPHPYSGGMLNTLRHAALLFDEIKGQFGIDRIVVGLRTDAYEREKLDALRRNGLEVRHCSLELVPAKFITHFLGAEPPHSSGRRIPNLARLVDGARGYDYLDCDAWIMWAVPGDGILAPLRPYAAFVADAIPRVAPEPEISPDRSGRDPFLGKFWSNYRHQQQNFQRAKVVFGTTPKTLSDAVSYLGVPRRKTILVPHIHVAQRSSTLQRLGRLKAPYFVWPTNTSFHKNQHRAIRAIKSYFETQDGKLDVVIVGPWSERLLANVFDNEHIKGFVAAYQSISNRHRRKIHLLGEVSDEQLASVFAHAEFIWQNVMYDNGTASAMECGELGVPVLTADYPQMRYWVETFGLEARFFNPYRVEATAMALKRAEQERAAGTFNGSFVLPRDYEKLLRTKYAELLAILLEPPIAHRPQILPKTVLERLS